jgi:hypothetical protein
VVVALNGRFQRRFESVLGAGGHIDVAAGVGQDT